MAIELAKSRVVASLALLLACGTLQAADPPTPEQALKNPRLMPVQKEVQIDRPEGADVAKCTIVAEKFGTGKGWVIRDASGQTLRKFIDTNGDNYVDQWCYYKDGVEVYRDIDTNFNQKADQCRWLNTAGSRWGMDTNEDGKVDAWQAISAEEVTAEVVAALRDRDKARFERLLLNAKDVKTLGLGKAKTDALTKKLETAITSFNILAAQPKPITAGTKWVSFAASQPGLVPAGTEESTADIVAYENAAAMIETDGKPQAITVGTLVKVKDAWRLIDAPQVTEDTVAEVEPKSFFFAPQRAAQPEGQVAGKLNEATNKLLEEQTKLGDPKAEDTAKVHERRSEILTQLAESDPEMRAQWYRQLADVLNQAVQVGYEPGIEKLKDLSETLKADPKDEQLAFYAEWRRLTAEHGQSLAVPDVNFAKVQTQWISDLETFLKEAKKYPESAEAMQELAISQEFAGEEEKALQWYDTIVKDFPTAPIHKKAEGAKTRLTSVGKSMALQGKLASGGAFDSRKLKDKVVLVQYWATWCEPAKSDMPLLMAMRAKYKGAFEVVGVCLDSNKADLAAFLKENDPQWPQLFEDGGLESRFAIEMGIQTLPTMILIDKQGRVVDRNLQAQALDGELKKLLK